MKVGIPKALGYYDYPILFRKFFEFLDIEVVLSKNTDNEILEEGIKNSLNESCLASKIFMGHVSNLVNRKDIEKIDYIFIPRLCTFENGETICVKFFALYDICKNVFDARFLTLNIDYDKNKTELNSFLNLGKKLGKSRIKIISAYLKAKKMQDIYDSKKAMQQMNDIALGKDNKLKVLVVSHSYIVYDKILGKKIIEDLKEKNVNVYFANINKVNMQNQKIMKWKKDKEKKYEDISTSVYWKPSKNILNGLSSNANKVDGIIYISAFPCGTDSLVNELAIRKLNNIPSINLILDEQDADVGLNTRIESFIDILNMNKSYNMKVSV